MTQADVVFLSKSESLGLLKFCIVDEANVAWQEFKGVPQVGYPGQT